MDEISKYYGSYWRNGIGSWSPSRRQETISERELIVKHIKPGAQALDVGCGAGRLADMVSTLNARYTGVDVSMAAVAECKKRGLNSLVCNLSAPLPFEPDTFDNVLVFEVLEHLFRPDSCLSEICRVLKPGGIVIGSVPNAGFLPNRIYMLAGIFNPGGSPATSLKMPWMDPHIRFFTRRTLRCLLLNETRFKNIRVIGENFSMSTFPALYKLKGKPQTFLRMTSMPLAFLGRIFPSLFAHTIYFVACKCE